MDVQEIIKSEIFIWLCVITTISAFIGTVLGITKFGNSLLMKIKKALTDKNKSNAIKYIVFVIFIIVFMVVLPVFIIFYAFMYLKCWLFWTAFIVGLYILFCFVMTIFLLISMIDILNEPDKTKPIN